MFLISAHQTYMNHKFLKKRLESNFCHNNNNRHNQQQHHLEEEQEGEKEVNKELNYLLNYEKSLNFLFKINQSNNGLTSKLIDNLNYQHIDNITEETSQMQRTKKYFTSNGHKFLFNNT